MLSIIFKGILKNVNNPVVSPARYLKGLSDKSSKKSLFISFIPKIVIVVKNIIFIAVSIFICFNSYYD
jgi:hypothetical protein